MRLLIALAIAGLIDSRVVDFIRTAFDKHDRVPKAYWLLAAWGVGMGEAFLVCHSQFLLTFLQVGKGTGCIDAVLAGLGYGASAGFWHEVLSAFSARSGPASTPKGLVPNSAP